MPVESASVPVAARLLALSQTYALASREMSLVAVVTRPGDRPGQLPETRVVPVGMAQDTDVNAYFTSMTMASVTGAPAFGTVAPPTPTLWAEAAPSFLDSPKAPDTQGPLFDRLTKKLSGRMKARGVRPPASGPLDTNQPDTTEDVLLDLASRMDSDGGMPGKLAESRAIATIIALLAFLSQGQTPTSGAFRSHVARLVAFLSLRPPPSAGDGAPSSTWLPAASRRTASGLPAPSRPAITGAR
jgi:hypothetical protein